MSRLPGSIDQRKKDAVLDAAAALVVARGPGISLGEVARRSKVSKQTIYNYFGDKPGLFQALLENRAGPSECPLCVGPAGAAPAAFLAAYAKRLLDWLAHVRLAASLRNLIASEHPRAGQLDQAGARAGAARALAALARVLADEARRGRMRIDDPARAADLFFDLVMAGRTSGLVQVAPDADPAADIETAADACGWIFAQAYAADPDDLEADLSAHPILLTAGRTPIGHPMHSRKEASR